MTIIRHNKFVRNERTDNLAYSSIDLELSDMFNIIT